MLAPVKIEVLQGRELAELTWQLLQLLAPAPCSMPKRVLSDLRIAAVCIVIHHPRRHHANLTSCMLTPAEEE